MFLTLASLIITVAICYGILHLTIWHWQRRRLYELASKFEGPPILPIIGNAHLFVGNAEYLMSQIQNMYKLYPSPFRVWFGSRFIVLLDDPERIKAICTSPKSLEKGVIAEFSRPMFGDGIFNAPATKWRVHRKLIQSTFNAKILDSFVEIFAAQSKILLEQIECNLDGPEFEIFNPVSACTLDMIYEAVMGIKIRAQINRNFLFVEAIQKAIASLSERFFYFWLQSDAIFYRTKLGKDQRRHIKYIQDFTDNIIRMRKNELRKRSSQPGRAIDEYDASDSTPLTEALFDPLLKPTNLSDQELRDEVITIAMAGHDAASITISSVMWILASHAEVQEIVYHELLEIYGDSDIEEHPVTSKDLTRMKYLERVIKETQRLFPAVPFIGRLVTDDLNIGDHTFPKGALAILGIFQLHRNEKYWPDPLTFDPDRFLPEEVAKRHPYAYMPFSNGPRNCISSTYAMRSMETMIATVLRKYVLKTDNMVPVADIRCQMEVLLKPVHPFKIRIERRTRK